MGRPEVPICPSRWIRKGIAHYFPCDKIFGFCHLDMEQLPCYLRVGGVDIVVPVGSKDNRRIGKISVYSRLVLLWGIIVRGILNGWAWVAGSLSSHEPAKKKEFTQAYFHVDSFKITCRMPHNRCFS